MLLLAFPSYWFKFLVCELYSRTLSQLGFFLWIRTQKDLKDSLFKSSKCITNISPNAYLSKWVSCSIWASFSHRTLRKMNAVNNWLASKELIWSCLGFYAWIWSQEKFSSLPSEGVSWRTTVTDPNFSSLIKKIGRCGFILETTPA